MLGVLRVFCCPLVNHWIVGLTMDQITLDKRAAYALGFYHGLYGEFEPNNPFMDRYYAEYRAGYDSAILEFCGIMNLEEVNQ